MTATPLPSFSVIIPTYGRPAQLRACLAAVARLDYPRDRFEVVVVDDGSPDPTASMAAVAALKTDIDVSLVAQANRGPAAARNTGVAHSRGDYIALTDDDCTPSPEWLNALATHFARSPDRMLGGRTLNALSGNVYSCASQFIQDFVYDFYNHDPEDARFFATNNLALPRGAFEEIGGFDPSFFPASEDRDLCDRWLESGRKIEYAPEATVYHANLLTLRRFWRQHFAYGRGAARFHAARALRGSGAFTDDIEFHLRLGRWYRALMKVRSHRGRIAALLLVWQVANACGFFRERWMVNRIS